MARVLGCFCVVMLLSPCRADDDAIKKKLDTAKSQYAAEAEKFRKVVSTQLEEREKKARDKGDKKTVDLIKTERQALEDKGEIPKSVPQEVKTKFTSARNAMEVAYKAAVSSYTTAKMDNEATAIEKELEEFKKGSVGDGTAVVPKGNDSLKAGMIFEGEKTNGIAGGASPFNLKVSEVDKGVVKGTVLLANNMDYSFSGKLSGTKLTFTVIGKDDKVNQAYSGTIQGDSLTMTYNGTAAKGGPIRGDVKAKLKSDK